MVVPREKLIMSLSRSAVYLVVFAALFSISAESAHALTLGQAARVAQSVQPAAFQTIEMTAANAADRTPQWQRVKAALGHDIAALQNCLANENACNGDAQIAWRTLVLGLQGQDQNTQLQLVNAFFNKFQYRSDAEIYGESDHWATPIAFMTQGGDCEDYAIAKYTTLLFLGFADRTMRIMAVKDMNRGGMGHAVLSVSAENGTVILDNQSDTAYADSAQTGYTPRFAVNQGGIYTYEQQPQIIYASLK